MFMCATVEIKSGLYIMNSDPIPFLDKDKNCYMLGMISSPLQWENEKRGYEK